MTFVVFRSPKWQELGNACDMEIGKVSHSVAEHAYGSTLFGMAESGRLKSIAAVCLLADLQVLIGDGCKCRMAIADALMHAEGAEPHAINVSVCSALYGISGLVSTSFHNRALPVVPCSRTHAFESIANRSKVSNATLLTSIVRIHGTASLPVEGSTCRTKPLI